MDDFVDEDPFEDKDEALRITIQICIKHTVALIFSPLHHAGPIFALCKFAKLVSDMMPCYALNTILTFISSFFLDD